MNHLYIIEYKDTCSFVVVPWITALKKHIRNLSVLRIHFSISDSTSSLHVLHISELEGLVAQCSNPSKMFPISSCNQAGHRAARLALSARELHLFIACWSFFYFELIWTRSKCRNWPFQRLCAPFKNIISSFSDVGLLMLRCRCSVEMSGILIQGKTEICGDLSLISCVKKGRREPEAIPETVKIAEGGI